MYRLNSEAYRDTEESFHSRQGQLKSLTWLTGAIETLEAEILGNTSDNDIEDDELNYE